MKNKVFLKVQNQNSLTVLQTIKIYVLYVLQNGNEFIYIFYLHYSISENEKSQGMGIPIRSVRGAHFNSIVGLFSTLD